MNPMISRRSLLRSSMAAGCLAAISNEALFASLTNRHLAKSKLHLGIQLYSLRNLSVEKALQHDKELGFEQVGL